MIKKHEYLKNVTTIAYNEEMCTGCGRCAEVCPHGVFDVDGNKATIIDRDSCMECGACSMNCPVEAIEVNAGTGCAAAIVMSWFTGKEPECGCSGDNDFVCC